MKPKEELMKGQVEQQAYDMKYDAALLKSKNAAMDTYTNMVTEETERNKLKQPQLKKKIDHRRVSSTGQES